VKATYIARPALDSAIARCLSSGAGVYAIEGPGGAGKSAALLHGLNAERERRERSGQGGRGHVRILQLWGDEPPSLFSQRLVREVGLLNLVAYPQPQQLARLCADMAQAIPGLSTAGKVLGSLLPNDLRPLPLVAAQSLAEAGSRAIEHGNPLCIGVDLLGGTISGPVRDFFSRLCEQLPPTVVLLFAQPGGQDFLVQVPPGQRIAAGPFTVDEAAAFFKERLGPQNGETLALLQSRRLSLLPGDLTQIVNLYTYLGREEGLAGVLPYLERDIAARYQLMFQSKLVEPGADPRVLELCALCAVTARPQQPLSLELALERMRDSPLRPSELAQLRQAPLVRALCASPSGEDAAGWPLLPASAQARDGVCAALERNGLLEAYERRWLGELLRALRSGAGDGGPGPSGLIAGMQALSLLIERASRQRPNLLGTRGQASLGQAVELLAEIETLLWRAGWHRAFAELYDALLPHLRQAGVVPRDVAPMLWFRRARARIQSIDWSPEAAFSSEEIELALKELDELEALSETAVVQARVRIGLSTDGNELSDWCRHLPVKARQARGYASILWLLLGREAPASGAGLLGRAFDDILSALAYFVATERAEDTAQTLTILGDAYSARGDDAAALYQYEQAVAVAQRQSTGSEGAGSLAFCLGIIHRSIGNHHRRRGRLDLAGRCYELARRYLLRTADARMGTLLASLLP